MFELLAFTITCQWWMLILLINIVTFIPVIVHDDGGGFMSGITNMVWFFGLWLPGNGLLWLIYFIIN